MISNTKRKSSTHASSPPPSKRSPFHAFSPPHYSSASPPAQYTGRPLTTAAAAVAAIKQQKMSPQPPSSHRRASTSLSRQGSVETEREGSVTASADDEGDGHKTTTAHDDGTTQKDNGGETAEADDDEKEEVMVDMDAHMQAQMEKAKEDMKVLLENFSDDQLQRYEGYRRSALNRTNVKRLVSQVLNQQCSQTMAFVVAGFSKVYIGEIVEKAKEIMEEWGDQGAIRPEHLREAHRRYKKERQTSASLGRKL
ncbi:MAG: hTAFII28-like protein conserved region-domain-containing protein [Benjaminiella poitrasii]|nr:MAG: hTAFII28-like protein conserved region-domain-containing protein [Benjaminiella poitrasii]